MKIVFWVVAQSSLVVTDVAEVLAAFIIARQQVPLKRS
jgi:hypothetical protein